MPRSDKKSLPAVKKELFVPIEPSAKKELFMPNKPVETPSLFGSLKQGFGFGLGNSIAHRLFSPAPVLDSSKKIEFTQCMEKTYTTYEDCAHHLD